MTLTELLKSPDMADIGFVYIGCKGSSGFFYMGDVDHAKECVAEYSQWNKKDIERKIRRDKRTLELIPTRIINLEKEIESSEQKKEDKQYAGEKRELKKHIQHLKDKIQEVKRRQETLPGTIAEWEAEHRNYIHLDERKVSETQDRKSVKPLGKIILLEGQVTRSGGWFIGDTEGEYIEFAENGKRRNRSFKQKELGGECYEEAEA